MERVEEFRTVFQSELEMSEQVLGQTLNRLYPLQVETPVGDTSVGSRKSEYLYLSKRALDDAEWSRMLEVFCSQAQLQGGQHRIRTMLQHPGVLSYRDRCALQKDIKSMGAQKETYTDQIQKFLQMEEDLLWVLSRQGRIDYPLSLLYPTLPVLRQVNHHGIGLHMLHFYKILGSPLMQLLMPLMSVLAPYYLLRRQMRMNISLQAYFRMLWLMGKVSFQQLRRRGSWKMLSSMGSVLVYLCMYVYGLVQTIEFSLVTYRARRELCEKARRLRGFFLEYPKFPVLPGSGAWLATEDHKALEGWDKIQASARRDADLVFLYHLIGNPGVLSSMADRLYAADALAAVRKIVDQKGWCYAEAATSLGDPPVSFIGMGHPLLKDGVRNPVQLDKNMVITGPNAAGKSTYMRAVLLNTMLGVTLGICCAGKARIGPIHAIHTQMRLLDAAGDGSLFENEVRSCKSLLENICRERPWTLVFLDEPMHSTNALEGASALKGLVERLGGIAGVRCMVTTHYHSVGDLPDIHAVCMEALPLTTGGFLFPYKIKKGVSRQSIALELLRAAIDDPFIDLAIAHKNRDLRLDSRG